MKKPITLIFDLDGTLVETAPDLAAAMNAVLRHEGRDEVSCEEVRIMVGQGAKALIRKGMEKTGTPASEDDVERLFPIFMDHYLKHMSDHSKPFPHLIAALKALKNKGYVFSICTNKQEATSHLLLEELDMAHWFDAVVGGDTLEVKKPAPDPLILATEKAGGERSKAIFIGDSKTDLDTAHAAGIPIIGVSFGYTEIPMAELGPDVLISSFRELEEAVEHLARRF